MFFILKRGVVKTVFSIKGLIGRKTNYHMKNEVDSG
jgi:hypothetical protein